MWRGILALVLIVAAIIWARQFSQARQDFSSNRDTSRQATGSQATGSQATGSQATGSQEEVEICRGNDSSTYEVDGKRYSLPFEVIDDQAVVEGDIVLARAADV